MNELRPFRYQAEQVEQISNILKKHKRVEAGIDYEGEVDEIVEGLRSRGIYKISGLQNIDFVDVEQNPEYYGTMGFYTGQSGAEDTPRKEILLVDFFYLDMPEDNERELMWGS